jgi:hypothetical protein
MNELSQRLLEVAFSQLEKKDRTLAGLNVEVWTCWYTWRNHQIEAWAEFMLPEIKLPASRLYYDTGLGDWLYGWLNSHGFHSWETPACDGEDDDFVLQFVAHCAASMAWLVFEQEWPQLDFTPEEIERFFNFKNAYAPAPPKKDKAGAQFSMF